MEELRNDVIAQKTVEVTNEEQHIEWEGYGLRLYIPHNSLPRTCSQFQLKMALSKVEDYKLPTKNGILVSGVYSFSHNLGERKLRQPATLEIQHCVKSLTQLSIIRCHETSPPYQFEIVPGGRFDRTDGYGAIGLDHFCGFGIIYYAWIVFSGCFTR